MRACVYIHVREGERPKMIISAGKSSAGQEMALARAADGKERAALARPGPYRAFQHTARPGCVVLTVRDSAEHLPRWHFTVCL